MKCILNSGKGWSRNATTIRLPKDYPWKLLDRLISDLSGSLSTEELELARGVAFSRDPERLVSLADAWGLQSSNVPEPSYLVCNLRARYQIGSFLKNFCFDTNKELRVLNATKKFIKAEMSCRQFNMSGWKHFAWSSDRSVREIFTLARSWITKVIGSELPDFGELTETGRHGPGNSSNTVQGRNSSYFKYSEWPYDCTRRARKYAIAAIQQDERWYGSLEADYRKVHNINPVHILDRDLFWDRVLFPVRGNRITFVPKSSQTERTIAIEPTMNLYLQLGVDGFIRRRLKRWGINLDDQLKNQLLARAGSISGKFATLDLSAASDTISMRLIRELLPKPWYFYLTDIRSSFGDLNGREIRYEKVSSMGNGYTFALESLIFGSLVYAVSKIVSGWYDRDKHCVYGDDIIVPTSEVPLLIKALNVAGFTVNHDKSFFNGLIRESCGADWFSGKHLRPVFLRRTPTDVKELFNDYNRIKRMLNLRFGITAEESQCLLMIHSWIPSKFKNFYGPLSDEEFDTYIHSEKNPSPWLHGTWSFSRLIRVNRTAKERRLNWRFRKLMATLYDGQTSCEFVRSHVKSSVSYGGSKFAVPINDNWYFALTNSASSFWSTEYAELPS